MNKLLTDDDLFESVYKRNVDTVYKVCYIFLKNKSDAEDLTQNTFIKYLKYNPEFSNLKHEKAWFIVTTSNVCKNHLKSWWKKTTVLSHEIEETYFDKDNDILEIILTLPVKYKDLIYMYYYEGYTTKEISEMTNTNESTIRTNLSKARVLLKEKIGSDL